MYGQRYSGIFSIDTPITIIGLGGIGSFTAVTLAKMGIALRLFDGDLVSAPNIGTQFYETGDVDLLKAFICHVHCERHSGQKPAFNCLPVTPDTDLEQIFSPIIISAVDSLETRQELWPLIKKTQSTYIDARMASELFTMYTVELGSYARYEKMLFSKSAGDIPKIPCTEKATSYTGNFAAGWIATAVRHLTSGKPFPFMLTHDIMNLSIKTLL